MRRLILALDQGTTSSRALLFDRTGKVIATAQEELPQIYPRPGEVEHDPEAIWESQLRVAREAMERAEVKPGGRRPRRRSILPHSAHCASCLV